MERQKQTLQTRWTVSPPSVLKAIWSFVGRIFWRLDEPVQRWESAMYCGIKNPTWLNLFSGNIDNIDNNDITGNFNPYEK